ncbi:hypothetical protein [Ottowia testudinis]|uniref:Uncharacterized protein n=1 Tax=Ottowia testudinis TaxID=2816950 RepID=A0A975H3P7_9BURK|nr:hypothetical protein [Ottowia testudinis]QTD45510.1 hypothetical protein J1M35_00850 [Ottowia testudinis]
MALRLIHAEEEFGFYRALGVLQLVQARAQVLSIARLDAFTDAGPGGQGFEVAAKVLDHLAVGGLGQQQLERGDFDLVGRGDGRRAGGGLGSGCGDGGERGQPAALKQGAVHAQRLLGVGLQAAGLLGDVGARGRPLRLASSDEAGAGALSCGAVGSGGGGGGAGGEVGANAGLKQAAGATCMRGLGHLLFELGTATERKNKCVEAPPLAPLGALAAGKGTSWEQSYWE